MAITTSQDRRQLEAGEWPGRCIQVLRFLFELDEQGARSSPDAAEVKIIQPKTPVPWGTALRLAYKRLIGEGCYPKLVERDDGIYLVMVRKRDAPSRRVTAILLALATLALVYISGLALTGTEAEGRGFAWTPAGYLVALLGPLIIHELGHWVTLRHYRTPASLPYLLPAPPLQLGFLGTFGAVINLRWLPPDNRSLALSAIAGPLAGFLAAIPFAVWGIKESIVLPASAAGGVLPLVPLVFLLLPVPHEVGAHEVLVLSPMGFAAFVVFFVTFLNLIPVASLDGGHIVRALLGYRGHKVVSHLTVGALLLASMKWPMLMLFTLIALAFLFMSRSGHPGSAMGLERARDPVVALVGVVYGLLLILTLPVPIS